MEFPRSERGTRELIKLNFMFLEKQDNYAPTFTQLAFNTCTQTLILVLCQLSNTNVFSTFPPLLEKPIVMGKVITAPN